MYNRPGGTQESGTRRPILRPQKGRILDSFTCFYQFLFHESKSLYQSIHCPENYLPSTLGSATDYEKLPFFGQTLTLTFRNSLILFWNFRKGCQRNRPRKSDRSMTIKFIGANVLKKIVAYNQIRLNLSQGDCIC